MNSDTVTMQMKKKTANRLLAVFGVSVYTILLVLYVEVRMKYRLENEGDAWFEVSNRILETIEELHGP